jgi:CheY-like chemotaxis protein
MAKVALIVDDSPLARHVLSKLLVGYGMTAETVDSAEAALEYLKHRRPDVVFMDHMMPGMDGFEALEAIKANPITATIPVMMYTSQEGELYVGQARALGAFGVLPKELKPVEVARVLQALHLIPAQPPAARTSAQPAGASPSRDPGDSQRVAALLEELFHQQRSALREEIREGYERALASTQPPPPAPVEAPAKRAQTRVSLLVALVLFGTTLTFGYLYFNSNRLLQQVTTRSTELIARTAQLSAANAEVMNRQQGRGIEQDYLDILEWAVNLSGTYGFLDVPLDDSRARTLARLIRFLDQAGFSGEFVVEVHVGRFCMNFGPDLSLLPAPETQPARDCQQIGWTDPQADEIARRQSVSFANLLAAEAQRSSKIMVETESYASDRPAVEYPVLTDFLSAGEWNAIAQRNHRVNVRLVRSTDTDVARPPSSL